MQDLQSRSHLSPMLWPSSLEVLHLLRLSTVSASLRVYKSAAFTCQYWQSSQQQWSGISDACIEKEEIVSGCAVVQKTLVAAAVENFYLQSKLNSQVYTLRRNEKIGMIALPSQVFYHLSQTLRLNLTRWILIVDSHSVRKDEEVRCFKGAWRHVDLWPRTNTHLP